MSEVIIDTGVEDAAAPDLRDNGQAVESAFEDSELRLAEALARAEEEVLSAWTSWREFVLEECAGKLTELFTEASQRHRRCQESFLHGTESSKDPATILDYRRAIGNEVVDVLGERFASSNLGDTLSTRFAQFVADVERVSEVLPSSVRLSQPRELFDSVDGDGPLLALRKLVRRKRLDLVDLLLRVRNRGRRILSRDEIRRVPPSRLVPVRDLASHYLQKELPALASPAYHGVQLHGARRIANAEAALTEWLNKILTEERDAEILVEGAHRPRWSSVAAPEREDETETAKDDKPDDEGGHDGEGSQESAADIFDRFDAIALELQRRLDTLSVDEEPDLVVHEAIISEVFARLRNDLSKAGTFILKSPGPDARERSDPASGRILRERWSEWHEQVADRFKYLDSILVIRDRMLEAEASIVDRTAKATVVPVIDTFVDMKRVFSDALEQSIKIAGQSKNGTDTYADGLTEIRNRLTGHLRSVFRDLPGLVSSDQALTEPGREEWDGLGRFVDHLPERLVMHELYDDDEEITAKIRTAEVNFRGLVNDVLLIRLPDRLRKPAEGLRTAVRTVWTETEQVQHIVQYNLDAAIDELRRVEVSDDGAATPQEKEVSPVPDTPKRRIELARQLTDDGLTRASSTLDQLASSLRDPWDEFVDSIDRELREDWVAIHRRLKAADSADEQWAGFRARTTRKAEKVLGRLRGYFVTFAGRAVRVLTAGRRRAQSLIRIGQSAVGVVDGGESARYETIDALSSIHELQKGLPLIYRRLFSFEPLDETSLLEGRARDLVWVKRHFDRWHNAMQMGVVLVQAPLGSGRTSFLNALNTAVFKDHDVRLVNLRERLYHPDEFAVVVANALGLDRPDVTIDELEEYLVGIKRADPPHVILIDNLEHLLMRAPQSVNVIERVILFMSHTDASVYWLGTIGAHAWQYLSKTAATAVSFVESYSLTSLDRSTLESLVINRHRRSGMPLNFHEPKDPSALMRQKLRRAKSPEHRQALLREDFFDRLWKASGENVMLALFYWIRSVDFSREDSVLDVQPLSSLNFDYVNRLDLDHAFTLKAFFLHKTLSLDDHCRIFHMSKEASTAILESLLNSCVIEPVSHLDRVQGDYHVRREAIYRLKPLLFYPVTTFLQSRNIVY